MCLDEAILLEQSRGLNISRWMSYVFKFTEYLNALNTVRDFHCCITLLPRRQSPSLPPLLKTQSHENAQHEDLLALPGHHRPGRSKPNDETIPWRPRQSPDDSACQNLHCPAASLSRAPRASTTPPLRPFKPAIRALPRPRRSQSSAPPSARVCRCRQAMADHGWCPRS